MLAALVVAAALAGPCRTVHGRRALWNGTPAVRISVLGTHRVLGVVQPNARFDDLPPAVRRIWTGQDVDADWKTAIEGDFRVCPAAPARPGRMQPVRVIGAANLKLRRRQRRPLCNTPTCASAATPGPSSDANSGPLAARSVGGGQ